MTQRILIALSVLVMAVSLGAYFFQSKKIAERSEVQQLDREVTTQTSTPKLSQIDPAPTQIINDSNRTSPPVITTANYSGNQNPSVVATPGSALLPPSIQEERLLPGSLIPSPGGVLPNAPSGALRYSALLSFVNDIKVVAQTDGIILDILVDEGSIVSKDSVMVQIDNRLASAEKEEIGRAHV